MSRALRVIDSGLLNGRRNVALDQALVELHDEGCIGPTLRFLRFTPSVLIGRHQALRREVDVDFCQDRGIETARRITGGGALYLDPGQLGWELVCDRGFVGAVALSDIAARLCEAAATGLSSFGIPVRFRPRNDLEVEGRKIGGTGGFYMGNTLFYQGTVLIELDATTMFAALRVPREKHARRGAAAPSDRVTDLRALLPGTLVAYDAVRDALLSGFERILGWTSRIEPLSELEQERAESLHDQEIGRDEFVAEIDEAATASRHGSATLDSPGGTVTATVKLARGRRANIAMVMFSGDFFVSPTRWILDLEARLKDTRPEEVTERIEAFNATHPPELLSVTVELLVTAIQRAVDQARSVD